MERISPERKSAALAKLLPPYDMTTTAIALTEGISEATRYNWRNQANRRGNRHLVQTKLQATARLAVFIETTALSDEVFLHQGSDAAYCPGSKWQM